MKICIDAGHNNSGADTGAVGIGGIREQDITFEIASHLNSALSSAGIETVMTRKSAGENLGTSVSSSLKERVRISNDNGCDFFISIHCNSGPESARGTEVFVSARGGSAEAKGAVVAEAISHNLSTVNRGVRVDTEYLGSRLYVLHNTLCPAILIETGFITNPDDAHKLISRSNEFAWAIASAFTQGGNNMGEFTDISGHWAKDYIEDLAQRGIISGYADGTFRPDQPITRAEAAALVSKALSDTESN